jgi:tetratricopeptide (TPR) repeat protein
MPELALLAAFVLSVVPLAAQKSGMVEASGLERQQRDDAQRAYERGQELLQAESFEEAVGHFRRAIALDPMHWLAHYGLGQVHMALKRYPEAIQAYVSCRDVFVSLAQLDASDQNTMEKLREDEIRAVRDSLLRVQQGKVKTGSPLSLEVQLQDRLRVLEGARLRGKENNVVVPAGLMLGLGSAHFRAGQMAEAQAAFLQAVQIDPKLGPAHNNLAVMYMMGGRYDQAKEEVKRAEKAGTQVTDAFKQELDRRAREAPKPR